VTLLTPLSRRQKRAQAVAAAIALLAETFPRAFFVYQGRRRPLKLNIHLDIQAALDGAITPTELHRALGAYCSNPFYLDHARKGAQRLDLDGKPAGAVTDDEEALARAKLAHIRTKKAARAATAKVQATPAKRSSLADLKAAALARKSDAQREVRRRHRMRTTQRAAGCNGGPKLKGSSGQLRPFSQNLVSTQVTFLAAPTDGGRQ
jgi:ProP effector